MVIMSGSVKPRLVESPIRRRRWSIGRARMEVSILRRVNLLSLDNDNPAQEISGPVTRVEAGSGSSLAQILLRRQKIESFGHRGCCTARISYIWTRLQWLDRKWDQINYQCC